MILIVTSSDHRYTFRHVVPALTGRGVARVVTYDWLLRRRQLRASCIVFTDFDRLHGGELKAAAFVYRRAREAGIRVLNDPAKARQRFDLLRALHIAGLNGFRAYPALSQPQPARFPVFVKSQVDHGQEFDMLIADQAELETTLRRIEDDGHSLRDLLVIEFANTPVREGIYQRRTMYRIGDRYFAGNPVGEESPFVKYGTFGLLADDDYVALAREMHESPDAPHFHRVFDVARIDYGRADYGYDEGHIAVYEINTNPKIGTRLPNPHPDFLAASVESLDRVVEAIRALDGENRIVTLDWSALGRRRFRFRTGFVLERN
ncbi:hypothetical protein [Oricola sp.]|uniref:hypothetical protein n=1 Tax=Oricola sp. TaxID=1979950 RepID=UPI003BAB8C4F